MPDSQLLGHGGGIHQLPVVGAVAGTERVHLPISRHLLYTCCHHSGVEPTAQRNSYPLVGLDLATECLDKPGSQGRRVAGGVFMQHLNRNVPEPGRVHPVPVHLQPGARGHWMNAGQTGSSRLGPLG